MRQIFSLIVFLSVWVIFISFNFFGLWKYSNPVYYQDKEIEYVSKTWSVEKKEFWFRKDLLKTNTAKKSIDLNLVLDWWPWKDWIPAINDPVFTEVAKQKLTDWLKEDSLWISVNISWESKFYPYSILYWHEIVNDTIWEKNISVTFCPLCWTAIVYDRNMHWELLTFWVSGKLYESNLLMYDDKTDSLWSQSVWKAVVWDYLWEKLNLIKSDMMTYDQFRSKYKDWLVLTDKTWFLRSYSRSPYWDYETNEYLYFPVSDTDKKLHSKELLYVVPYDWKSYGFVREELKKIWELKYKFWKEEVKLVYNKWEITAYIWDKIIPWYVEMYFSWNTQHPNNENIRIGK